MWYKQDCLAYDSDGLKIEQSHECMTSYWDTSKDEVALSSAVYWLDFVEERCIRSSGRTNDDVPMIAKKTPQLLRYESLHECCQQGLHYMYSECMASEQHEDDQCSPPPEYSMQWYVVYSWNGVQEPECVQECRVGATCSGEFAEVHSEMYATYVECCTTHLWWKEDSQCKSGGFGNQRGYYPVRKVLDHSKSLRGFSRVLPLTLVSPTKRIHAKMMATMDRICYQMGCS